MRQTESFMSTETPETGIPERRTTERRGHSADHQLKLRYQKEALNAQLIDYSNGGLGVWTQQALEWGTTVQISGTVRMSDVWMRVQGLAAVVHCDQVDGSGYRVGLRLDHVQWNAAEPPAVI